MTKPDAAFANPGPESGLARELLGLYDSPAYVRRALRVHHAIESLLHRCRRQREEWLAGVRLRLRQWQAAERDAPKEESDGAPRRAHLQRLCQDLLQTDAEVKPWLAAGRPKRLLRELEQSIERFNRRWWQFTEQIDFAIVNQHIDGFNANYLLEKECAFRSPRLAARGYKPMEPIDADWLRRQLPLLVNGSEA